MEKKCYVASQQTKWALAAALKKLMAQKPLEKITISELTDLCHIKRQNFYYHFEDIYDLMRWMFQNEAVSLLERREGALLWRPFGALSLFTKQSCSLPLRAALSGPWAYPPLF